MILENSPCIDCGEPMVTQDECDSCHGEDLDGQLVFCKNCEFCCGC